MLARLNECDHRSGYELLAEFEPGGNGTFSILYAKGILLSFDDFESERDVVEGQQ